MFFKIYKPLYLTFKDLLFYKINTMEDDHDENQTREEIKDEEINTEEISIILRKRLLDYSYNTYYPICEYLDLNSIDNFVKSILKF